MISITLPMIKIENRNWSTVQSHSSPSDMSLIKVLMCVCTWDTYGILSPGWRLGSTTSPALRTKARPWALPSLDYKPGEQMKLVSSEKPHPKDMWAHINPLTSPAWKFPLTKRTYTGFIWVHSTQHYTSVECSPEWKQKPSQIGHITATRF